MSVIQYRGVMYGKGQSDSEWRYVTGSQTRYTWSSTFRDQYGNEFTESGSDDDDDWNRTPAHIAQQ